MFVFGRDKSGAHGDDAPSRCWLVQPRVADGFSFTFDTMLYDYAEGYILNASCVPMVLGLRRPIALFFQSVNMSAARLLTMDINLLTDSRA